MEKSVYLDEQILKKRENRLKEIYSTLKSGVYIQGCILTFNREVIHDLFSMMIPKSFDIMPENYAKVKYTSEFRPQYLLTSADLTVNLGFNVFPDHLTTTDMKQVVERVKQTLQNGPNATKFKEAMTIKELDGYYFDFRQHVMDSDIYQMMAFFRINQQLHQFSFNCLYSRFSDWKPIALQMLESIEYEKKG